MIAEIKILLVEDNPYDIEILQYELKKGGIKYVAEVVETEQGYIDALHRFVPDIILSDYNLPAFNGEASFKIRQDLAPDTPFIFVSGFIGEEKAVELIRNGVTDYVLKDKMFTLPLKIERALREAEVAKLKTKKEAELSQSELKLARAQQLGQMGSWELDYSTNILKLSKEGAKIFGLPINENELSAETWVNMLHPEDRDQILETIQASRDSLIDTNYSHRIICNDGKVKHIYSESKFEFNEDGVATGLYGIVQDVTEKKRNEKIIMDERILLRTVIDNLPAIIYCKDMLSRKTLSNRADYEYIGAEFEEAVLGKKDSYFFSDETARETMLEDKQIFDTGQAILNKEELRKKKDGGEIWFLKSKIPLRNHNNEIIGLVGISYDITEKKKEELRLKLLEAVIVNTNEAVVITEAEPIELPGPRIEFVNDAYTRMTGFTSEEAIGQTPRITQNEKTDRKELDRVAIARKSWQPFEMTVLNTKKSGEEFWVNVRATPIADEKGWFTHWVAIQRDVTKEKETELERAKITDDLIRRNKDLEQFTYIVSHNLRHPVTNIMGIINVLTTKQLSPEKEMQLKAHLSTSAFKLDEVIRDLNHILNVRGNLLEEKVKVNFKELLVDVEQAIGSELQEKEMSITANFEESGEMNTLKSYLYSIFYNLISNSIKYRQQEIKLLIEIISSKNDNKIQLIFKDNGLGIDLAQYSDDVFGLYKRFHLTIDGKGMGLYMVKTQVEKLGGTIKINSEVNKGTEVIIEFKIADD